MNYLTDSLVLIISGIIVCLYGSGRLFANLESRDIDEKSKMKPVLLVGAVIILAGLVQLLRYFL